MLTFILFFRILQHAGYFAVSYVVDSLGDNQRSIRYCLIKMTDKKQGVADLIRFHPQWVTLLKSLDGNEEVWLHATPKSLALKSFYSALIDKHPK